MKFSVLKYLLFFFFALWANGNALAQNDAEDEEIIYEKWEQNPDSTDRKIQEEIDERQRKKQEYFKDDSVQKTEVNYKPLNESKWKKYNTDRDYLEKPKEEKKEKSNSKLPSFDLEGFGFMANLLKIFVYIIVVLGFAFFIFKLIEAQYKKDKIVKNEKLFFLDKLEEKIHSVDLDKLLEKYSKKKDFAMMIRIQYLIIIKELSNKKMIAWHIQKTNGNYLQEVFGKPIFEDFKNVTQLFERIWFGEVKIDEKIYNIVVTDFKEMLNKIKQF